MPKTAYKHLFFDLDHTLWDFERNSNETLAELYQEFGLRQLGVSSSDAFQKHFHLVNAELWQLYDTNQITQSDLRQRRFRQVLQQLACQTEGDCDAWNDWYLAHCPKKPHLMPGAFELLEYLAPRYKMHIITNGFDEVQGVKLSSSGITDFFREVVTSQRAGARKPQAKMFQYAFEAAGCQPEEALMIGDNPETDIAGALGVGMHAAYFRPEQSLYPACEATYQIKELKELKNWL
ncbi:MAG: YjjG family noncanonical pyrimidine nucleotidase [Siphonobacter sp.]